MRMRLFYPAKFVPEDGQSPGPLAPMLDAVEELESVQSWDTVLLPEGTLPFLDVLYPEYSYRPKSSCF